MSAVNATSGFDYSTLNAKAEKAKDTAADMQQSFLKLLITQMQNQDPMNPMDNAQTTSQMAQINTVTGIQQLNTTMTQMMASMAGAQGLQAAAVVGKDVMAPVKELDYAGKDGVDLGLDLPAGHKGTQLAIVDAAGNVIEKVDIPASQTGYISIKWDGKLADGTQAPAGSYHVLAASINASGKEQAIDVFGWQKAASVTLASNGTKVQLTDGTIVDFDKIKQLR
ncbi:flagellar hook assembly protein FlgD [Jeongeupia chitinilytica]|uniref:Basal-body rod modification protein FlgD n=1 Tax=Jeongeupia chitinilytica TaxID=1041641 RepID=A0ABQ3GVL9_9NEIS|nr:flagellar hook capping FlgD N-terminal domain-containing protein [Jeongeupia chitinilytica]GHD57179.1 basal-body rod modification protein FlgD [Jeongeupia chitinilytica]